MHVENRQRVQQHVVAAGFALLLEAPELVEHARVGGQIAVRQHRPLAAAGGARRVDDRRHVRAGPRHGGELVRERRRRLQQRAVSPLAERDHLRAAGLPRQRLQLGQPRRRADEDRRPHVVHEVRDLRRLVGSVQRHVGKASAQRRQVQHHRLGRLFDLHRDARRRAVGIGAGAEAGQPAGDARRAAAQVAPRVDEAVGGLDARRRRVARHAAFDQRVEVAAFLHRPLKFGGRRPRKAAMPSRWSSESRKSKLASSSRAV